MSLIRDHFVPITLPSANPMHTMHGCWVTAESGTNTQFSSLAGEAGHPGILQIRTSNASGSFGRIFGAPSGWHLTTPTQPSPFRYGDIAAIEWVVRIPDMTSVAFTLSLADSIYLTHSVAFTYDTNVSNSLNCITSGSGGTNSTQVTAPTVNTWVTLRAECSAGQVDFKVDGVTVASHTDTSKLPSNAMAPYAAVFARASAYKYLDLDMFYLT